MQEPTVDKIKSPTSLHDSVNIYAYHSQDVPLAMTDDKAWEHRTLMLETHRHSTVGTGLGLGNVYI